MRFNHESNLCNQYFYNNKYKGMSVWVLFNFNVNGILMFKLGESFNLALLSETLSGLEF